jgi:hypothetical protein
MNYHIIFRLILIVTCVLCNAVPAADYNAVNEKGVRIFSPVPETGVHPRVLMSPEDMPEWRKEVIKTYRGKAFFSKR